jgi:hypothetical protein
VRVAHGDPGDELQVDFGRKGLMADAGHRRVVWALILHGVLVPALLRVADASPDDPRRDRRVQSGLEVLRALFRTVVPDNLEAIVDGADRLEPRLNQAFVKYARPAPWPCIRHVCARPQGKPRVERTVPFARNSFWAREYLVDLADAQRSAEA